MKLQTHNNLRVVFSGLLGLAILLTAITGIVYAYTFKKCVTYEGQDPAECQKEDDDKKKRAAIVGPIALCSLIIAVVAGIITGILYSMTLPLN